MKKMEGKIATNLAFTTEPPEKFVVLKFALLIGHDFWHFVDESRPWLWIKAHAIEGQDGVIAHGVHHF